MPTPETPRASEERLDALREEARKSGRVAAPGAAVAGGPIPAPGYYGRGIVKPPVWTWEVPLYFFLGGLAGMAAAIALVADVAGEETRLVRTALAVALAGAILSPILLVLDLGRPTRFLNMLRVFKWRSPMSMGVWFLVLFGASVTAALVLHLWIHARAPVGTLGLAADILYWAALAGGALLGLALSTYTGVLIGATAVPAWFAHHRGLPVHFGAAGLGAAVATLELLGFRIAALHALGIAVSVVETLFGAWIELHHHGAVDRALREGAPGFLLRSSGLLAGPVALTLRLLGLVPAADVAFLLGAIVSRYGWVAAGHVSGRDPEATLAAQR